MRVLITGATGQDGSYLAETLCADGHQVWALIRGQDNPKAAWLQTIAPNIHLIAGDLTDSMAVRAAVRLTQPDVVYHLGAISSPGLAWGQPELTVNVTGTGALRLLQAVWEYAPHARVLQACSIAEHGPYGAAKAFARIVGQDYRARGLHVTNLVFGGHHSPRRGPSFFARKVTQAVAEFVNGKRVEPLTLGSLARVQDWGNAADFIRQLPHVATLPPDDYVMSTGDPHSAEDWVETAFRMYGLNYRDHITQDPTAGNVTDVPTLTALPDPRIDWTPDRDFDALIKWMVEADL